MPKDAASSLLQQSGLSNEILGNIWHSCKTSQFPDLQEDEFVNMMNMAQLHLKPYDWFITDKKRETYAKEFQGIGTYQGNVRKADVYLFVRSNIKLFTIQLFDNVYEMVDVNFVDNLTLDQFTILRHVIDEYTQGVTLPSNIPINILGNVASQQIEVATRATSQASLGLNLANDYLANVDSNKTSTETLNSDVNGDLDQDVKIMKDLVLSKLQLPDELKSLEFHGNICYLLLLDEMIDINQELSTLEVSEVIPRKLAKIKELESLIEKEKLTML